MRIKIFRCEDMEMNIKALEGDVNEFIKDKKVIDIKYQEHTSYDECNLNTGSIYSDIFGSILVLYEDGKNEK